MSGAKLTLEVIGGVIGRGYFRCGGFGLFQGEGMLRFDSAEGTDGEAAAGVSLQVFDVGAGSVARFFERLHRAMAIFAAHELIAFGEGFVEAAGEPASTHLHLAFGHHRRFFLGTTGELRCLPVSRPPPRLLRSQG